MADAILSLVERPDERRRMAEAARRYAESQSWDTIMGGLRDRYLSVVEGAGAALAAAGGRP
jgi:hypothetical protein